MNDIPTWLLPLLTLVIGGGGIGSGFVLLRKEARQAPIEWRTAQIADAVAVSEAARALLDTVRQQLSDQNAKLTTQDTRLDEQDRKLEEQAQVISQLRFRLDRWVDWYADLALSWPTHRISEVPPAPPE